MTAQNHGLFRQEIFESRSRKLDGDVSLAVPMSWQAIGYLLLLLLVVVSAFLFSASYSRIEIAEGGIALDAGVASIVPSKGGVVVDLRVRDGSRVDVGDLLVGIRSDQDLAEGGTSAQRILDAIAEQDRRLASQGRLVREAADAERRTLLSRLAGLSEELASIEAQIEAQRQLVAVAEREFASVQSVAGRGFISRRDVNERENTLLGRQQQLAQLEQARAAKRSQIAEGQRTMAQLRVSAEVDASNVQSTRAGLLQQQAQTEASRGYAMTSPVQGTVTAVTARRGQPAVQGQQLMAIMPDHARPVAELYVATGAAGFLSRGQLVRLAVDAFPPERFGTVEARIREISSVAIPRQGANGVSMPVYLVTAEIADPEILAFGRRQLLLPGMTLTARIETERRSLIEWLFEPLFAVARR